MEVAHVLDARELVVQHRRVAHVANPMPCLVWIEILKDRDLARRGKKQSSQDAQQRRLACAILPQEHVTSPGLKRNRDLAKSRKGSKQPRDRFNASQCRWQSQVSRGGKRGIDHRGECNLKSVPDIPGQYAIRTGL